MHDIIFMSNGTDAEQKKFLVFKTKYPFAKHATSYEQAKQKSFTKLFWLVWSDVDVVDNFDFKYDVPEWDHQYVHVFKNDSYYNGICLISKTARISNREFDNRFFINKKEIDIVASIPSPYAKFTINTYEDYLLAIKQSPTSLFWAMWPNVEIIDNSVFNLRYNPLENHMWKNLCNDTESYINGLTLFSTHKPVSKKEVDHKFLINKEIHDAVVTRFRYPKYYISTYEEYLEICKTETQPLFWCIWPEIEITDESIFDLYYDPLDGTYDYDRKENHVWKNLCNDTESYINGLTLFTTFKTVSKKEFDHKFLISKKEHNQTASRFRYPRYYIDTYEEYLEICKTETQPLFWCIWPEIEITDNTIFDLYYDPLDGTYNYDRKENHVFQNTDIDEIKYNGLMLMSTATPVSKKEINFRYIVVKKEHERLVSKLKLYDIVFISYYESSAEENYSRLTTQFPDRIIHRVTNVTGIHNAHIQAAKLSTTPMFWVVDADAILMDDFKLDLLLPKYDRDAVFVWKSKNPVNSLEYGYGGVKLLPKKETIEMDITSTDMTTSISKKFNAMPLVSNITAFNTDPFSSWKSAFRECVKLSSKAIDGQVDIETEQRLDVWCSLNESAPYGFYAYLGALAGRAYGQENAGNKPALVLINDFKWLRKQFELSQRSLERSQQ